MMILAQIALPSKAADSFVIVGVLLAILGTLFLAYDLLGRENGPLRWFTLLIICGLVSALVLATIGTIANVIVDKLFNNPINLNFTVPFLVLGGSMGFFTVILVELPASKSKPPIFSRKGSLIGLAFGLTFAFVNKFILRGPTEATLVLGGSCAVIISVWQHITWEPSPVKMLPLHCLKACHSRWSVESSAAPGGSSTGNRPIPSPTSFCVKGFGPGLWPDSCPGSYF